MCTNHRPYWSGNFQWLCDMETQWEHQLLLIELAVYTTILRTVETTHFVKRLVTFLGMRSLLGF